MQTTIFPPSWLQESRIFVGAAYPTSWLGAVDKKVGASDPVGVRGCELGQVRTEGLRRRRDSTGAPAPKAVAPVASARPHEWLLDGVEGGTPDPHRPHARHGKSGRNIPEPRLTGALPLASCCSKIDGEGLAEHARFEIFGGEVVALCFQRRHQAGPGDLRALPWVAVLTLHGGDEGLQSPRRLLRALLAEQAPQRLGVRVPAPVVTHLVHVNVFQQGQDLLALRGVLQRVRPVLDLRIPREQQFLPPTSNSRMALVLFITLSRMRTISSSREPRMAFIRRTNHLV